MAKCPGCGEKLHLYNWKPVCPHCGVNLNYYNSNENLLEEAEKSERENAKFRPKIDRAKIGTISSIYGIVRLVLRALPLAALFLPLATADGNSINALGVYNFISSADIGKLLGNVLAGDKFSLSILFLFLAVVMILINLFMLFGAMGKKWIVREPVIISIFTVFGILSAVFWSIQDTYIGNVKIGAFVFIGIGVLQLVWNFVILSKSVEITYTPWLPVTSKDYVTGKALPVNYTECLIGGLPSHEYYALVEQGKSKEEIRRVMLPVLAKYQDAANKKRELEEAEKKREEDRRHGIES